jgi:parvulin-like peptidyl-prolyl isomerase
MILSPNEFKLKNTTYSRTAWRSQTKSSDKVIRDEVTPLLYRSIAPSLYHSITLLLYHFITLSLFFTSIAMVACKNDRGTAVTGDVAARVNETVIRVSEIDRLIEQQLRTRAQQGQSPPTSAELAMARLQVLEGLITQQALYEKAKRQELLPTEEELTQGIQKIKRERNLSEEAFQRMVQESGQTPEQFRQTVREQLAIQKLYDREVTPHLTVTDREIEEFYQSNRAQFVERRGFLLSQIVVSPENDNVPNDAVGPQEAERKIKAIYEQLRTGGDFATVAASRSEDPITGPRGGGPGFVPETSPDLSPAFVQRLAAMRDGDITEPIKVGDKWYIFKLNGRVTRDRELRLDEVRSQIAEELRKQREQVLQAAITQIALAEARVENYMARRMLENPTNFGNLRPISIPAAPSSTKPATGESVPK